MVTISAEVLALIEDVLVKTLGPHFAGFSVSPNRPRDSDGDPALFIVARFDPADALPPSRAMIDAMVAIREDLLARGDERLPYVDFVYPDERPSSDEAA